MNTINLKDWKTEDLKKEYNKSITIILIAVLTIFFLLSVVFHNWVTLKYARYHVFDNLFYLSILVLNFTTFIGLVIRAKWGRIVGIITCGIWCFEIPIGTIFGISGIIILSLSSKLFGSERILHKDLKEEIKSRKKKTLQGKIKSK